MDATSTVAQAAPVVNWLLLGELCVVVIVACAFLLYHNRLWGTVIAFFLRLYFWRVHHAYITIGSLHVAPLAGRIAFRNLEYHSSNISARILHGNITFRYWKPRVRQEGDSGSSNIKRGEQLPCSSARLELMDQRICHAESRSTWMGWNALCIIVRQHTTSSLRE